MLKYDVYGEESGYLGSFNTLKEAQQFIKELKQFDKRNNIEDIYYIYYIELEEE